MRERVEDLGRIAEKLKQILDSEIFNEFPNLRTKDLAGYLLHLPEQERFDKINFIMYAIRDLEIDLAEVHQIARYGDELEDCCRL